MVPMWGSLGKTSTAKGSCCKYFHAKDFSLSRHSGTYSCEHQSISTIPKALKKLEKIEMTRRSDGIYRLDHAITALQKAVLSTFGMAEEDILMKPLLKPANC